MHNTRKRKRSNSKRSNSKRSNSKRSKHKRSKHKRSKHKRSSSISKRSAVKNGGSYIYDMDSGEYRTVDDGQDFFRKNLSTT